MSYQDTIILPSRGLIYDKDMCPGESVRVRAMLTEDESLLASANNENIDQLLSQLIHGCVVDGWKGSISRMISADRLAVLYGIRKVTYGGEYQFSVTCPNCRFESIYAIDLSRLPVTYMEDDDIEPYFLTLPVSGDRISWRFLRGDDEQEAIVYRRNVIKRSRGALKTDPTIEFQQARRILSINGEENLKQNEVINYVKKMHSRDRLAWSKDVREHSIGIDMELEVTCKNFSCGRSRIIELPQSDDFFRPELSGERELSEVFADGHNVAYDSSQDAVQRDNENASTAQRELVEHADGGSEEAGTGNEQEQGSNGDTRETLGQASPVGNKDAVFTEG